MDKTKRKMIDDAVLATVVRKAEERGREIGREKAKIEIASNLLKNGYSIDFTAGVTGLTTEQAEDLNKSLD